MLRISIAILSAFLAIAPLQAGIFGKKTKPNANQVAEWVQMVLNHPEASKRAEAAEALADVDASQHPEAILALVEALQKDGSVNVRKAAASSLGKLQPRSVEAAEALDRAIRNDDSWSVRMAARWARLGYRVPKQSSPAPEKPRPVTSVPSNKPIIAQPASAPGNARPLPASPAAISPGRNVATPSPGEAPVQPPVLFPVPPPSQLELAPPPRPQPGGDASTKPAASPVHSNAPPATLQPPAKAVRPPIASPTVEPGPILVPPQ